MAATNSIAVGIFHDAAHARQAVRALRHAGFREDEIGVLAQNKAAVTHGKYTEFKGSQVAEGAAVGLATGAGIGALWALAFGAGVLPAVGPVIAGGLLASVLASATGGAAIAGVVGALIGLGIPEEEAHYYEREFKFGRTLVTVKCDGRYNEALEILKAHGAYTQPVRPSV